MPPRGKKSESLGLEASLWESANRLRSSMDAAEYKHAVLGLIFLKYMSDVFASRRTALVEAVENPDSDYYMPTEAARQSILESRDEYTAEGVFWMPEGHRWDDLRKAAKQPDIGARIDAAMDAIEKENPSLRGVLPKTYARKELTPATLGGLIDTFSRDDLSAAEHKGMDVLGRVYAIKVLTALCGVTRTPQHPPVLRRARPLLSHPVKGKNRSSAPDLFGLPWDPWRTSSPARRPREPRSMWCVGGMVRASKSPSPSPSCVRPVTTEARSRIAWP